MSETSIVVINRSFATRQIQITVPTNLSGKLTETAADSVPPVTPRSSSRCRD